MAIVSGAGGNGGPPSGAAGGDLTGNYPNPTIGAKKVTASKLADPGTGQVWGSDGVGNAAAVFPPGYLINITRVSSPVTISGTASGSATTLIDSGMITYDGTAVEICLSAPYVEVTANASGNTVVFELFDGNTSLFRLSIPAVNTALSLDEQVPLFLRTVITPSAATHDYNVRAWRTNANCTLAAGAATAGNPDNAILTIKKL